MGRGGAGALFIWLAGVLKLTQLAELIVFGGCSISSSIFVYSLGGVFVVILLGLGYFPSVGIII